MTASGRRTAMTTPPIATAQFDGIFFKAFSIGSEPDAGTSIPKIRLPIGTQRPGVELRGPMVVTIPRERASASATALRLDSDEISRTKLGGASRSSPFELR